MSDTEQATLAATQSQRPPFYRDATVVKWLAQVLALLLVIFALVFLSTQLPIATAGILSLLLPL